MSEHEATPLDDLDVDVALRAILQGTSTETGERFFFALVRNLCEALKTEGAWVTEYVEGARSLRARAMWLRGEPVTDYEYELAGTPCEPVFAESRLVHIPENAVKLFPDDPDLREVGAVSYMGVPLEDVDGTILGHLAVLDTRPMPEQPRLLNLFRIFAARAAAELRRLRAESRVREREEKLRGLVDGALDAIIELDGDLTLRGLNPAAEEVFACSEPDWLDRDFRRFLTEESAEKLAHLVHDLEDRPETGRRLWIAGGLEARTANGESFPAEASLSRYEVRGRPFFTLILRNVNDRLEAERRIRSLTEEARYLREEIRALHNFDEIIGESPAMLSVLKEVDQVASEDTTVLLLGETGTGKELFARAIHAGSRRRDRPLVKVNCAAIPSTLVESEFFGHEKGAFTGATARRDGRFALADGGTIFLDEIAELSPDLQAKILRVLQEGEFEPLGSSRPLRVDVRVVAATNRDLRRAVEEGAFREDLYYRLSVFPVEIPPLRDRGDDVIRLAEAFSQRFAERSNRVIEPLSDECRRRLRAYSWPGNVRELENVVERAVITSRGGRLDLDRALPEGASAADIDTPVGNGPAASVLTIRELKERERVNIVRALQSCDWRVSGEGGAARLLGVPPSTLSSRMKSLGIERPRRG